MAREIKWIANLKAVCIFLVVLGHFADLPPLAKVLIYAFHLPAFLVVTGYLSYTNLTKMSLGHLIRGPVRYYILVYALFTLGACFIWYVLEARHLPVAEIRKPLYGGLLGVHGPDLRLVHNDDPLWYFPFLVVSILLSYALLNTGSIGIIILTAVIAGVYALISNHPIAWSLDLAAPGAFFILLGVAVRFFENKDFNFLQRASRSKSVAMLFCVWLAAALFNGQVNINSRIFGHSWVLFIIAAVAGTGFVAFVCHTMPASRVASTLSRNTLVIFCSHIYLVKALNKIFAHLPISTKPWLVLASAVLVTAICCGFSILVDPWLVKWLKPKSTAKAELRNA